jgi:hypothetical protein
MALNEIDEEVKGELWWDKAVKCAAVMAIIVTIIVICLIFCHEAEAKTVNSRNVVVSLTPADVGARAVAMRFSLDGVYWSIKEAYHPTKEIALLPGEGHRCVYVQFANEDGDWSEVFSACVELVPIPTPPEPGTVEIEEVGAGDGGDPGETKT